ncbi:hypothetical protein [Paragemmobacter straminiformis]|uniref:hypothetical protein n=1 Tax=Paragemmobacter straminiformis TaxID=2045119 RepID=UPI00163AD044|nr:hypothetical protein [Gemmobacter straminiformis]
MTDELFALSLLVELLDHESGRREAMLVMCKESVERCRRITAGLWGNGGGALRQAATLRTMQRMN